MQELHELKEYCETEHQRKILEVIIKEGSNNKAAKKLKVGRRSVDKTLTRIKANAAKKGFSPKHDMTHVVPDGYQVKGTSTLYDAEGKPKMQWVKSQIDVERYRKLFNEALEAFTDILPKEKPVAGPKHADGDLLNKYIITDYHIGMMSWHEETGADWNLQIAEDTLVKWFQTAIAESKPAAQGLFLQMGDFLHWDGLDAVTPTSKHVLDADTRFAKLVRVAIRVLRRVIRLLLAKHETVHVIFAEGNHDLASSVWLRECFASMYSEEPRLTFDQNPDPYYCHEFGKNAFFVHHGHKKKMTAVDSVFVAKFREIYGRTDHHFADLGHLHHERLLESNLMVLEQHRTLAAPDSHASRGGWMSGRDSKVKTYHRELGAIGENTISAKCLGVE